MLTLRALTLASLSKNLSSLQSYYFRLDPPSSSSKDAQYIGLYYSTGYKADGTLKTLQVALGKSISLLLPYPQLSSLSLSPPAAKGHFPFSPVVLHLHDCIKKSLKPLF